MDRLFLSAAMVAITAGTALAVDLPTYGPASDLKPTTVAYDWSGLYGGIQGGWGWSDLGVNDGLGLDETIDLDGGFVGGIVGAQWQWDRLVAGIEGDLNWSGIEGDNAGPAFGQLDGEVKWFGSVNAKLGIPFGRVLPYAVGGVAFADARTGQAFLIGSSHDDQRYMGWTIGAGLDYAVSDSFIAGLQYKYYDFGDADFELDGRFTDRQGDLTLHTVSARLVYKFNPF